MIAYSSPPPGLGRDGLQGHTPTPQGLQPVPVYAVPVLVKRRPEGNEELQKRDDFQRYKNLAKECREHFAHQAMMMTNLKDALQTAQHMITSLSLELQMSRSFSRTLEERVTLLETSVASTTAMQTMNHGELRALTSSSDHFNAMLSTVMNCIDDEKFMHKEKELLSLLEAS
jgi:hypothetical protein